MKTAIGLFAFSALFGAAIALTYWLIAREPTGTILLGLMAAALSFTAAYALLAERRAQVEGDTEAALPVEDDLGVFTPHSVWPIFIAFASAMSLIGLLWSPLLGLIATAAAIACTWRLGAESARTGGR